MVSFDLLKRKETVTIDIPYTTDVTIMDEFIVTDIRPLTGDEEGRGNKNSIVRITLKRL